MAEILPGVIASVPLELYADSNGSLPHGFNVKLAYSRQNVKDIEDVNPAAVGYGLATVGRGGVTV